MQKTSNYQLNQWEPGDAVNREDFNADNAAIDAALGELSTAVESKAEQADLDATNAALGQVSAANCFVKLGGPVVTTTKGQAVTFDLSGVDMSEYAALFILAQGKSNDSEPIMVNGVRVASILSSGGYNGVGMSWLQPDNGSVYSISNYYNGQSGYPTENNYIGAYAWNSITNVAIGSSKTNIGVRFYLYGIKA